MGLAGERVSHPSISLWRFLAKEERSQGGWDLSPFQGHDRAGSSPPQSVPSTRVRKVVRPPDALQGPVAPSVGCLEAHHYVPAGSSRQQPG